MQPFVAIHIGAGYHSTQNEAKYKKLCTMASDAAIEAMKAGASATLGVCAAIRVLEDSSLTNAGYGSNLNADGYVECDAGIMEGSNGLSGGVAAVRGVDNPIDLAYEVMKCQADGSCAGLIPPLLLCGDGARAFAKKRMPQHLAYDAELDSHHITESSRQKYKSNKQTLRDWREARVASLQSDAGDDCLAKNSKRARTDFTQDTVGAICSDSNGSVTSGVSSGGISLKMPGRVGEAALYGCGCYADSDPQKSKDQERGSEPSGVGVSISGTGEYIQRSMLALNCGQQLARENDADPATTLHGTITREMLDCRFLRNVKAKPVGVLAVKRNVEGLEVIYAHNTASFGLGYRLGDAKAVAIMSRLDSLSANTLKTSSIFCKYA